MLYQVPWAKEFLATVIFSIAYHGGGMPQMVNGQTKMDLNEDPSVWYHCNGWFLWPSGRYYISQILIIWEHMMIQVFSYHQSCALPLSPIFFYSFCLIIMKWVSVDVFYICQFKHSIREYINCLMICWYLLFTWSMIKVLCKYIVTIANWYSNFSKGVGIFTAIFHILLVWFPFLFL